jgi:hypothetical protein
VPTIPRNPTSNLRKAVEKLRAEKRPFLHFVYGEEHIWLVRSTTCAEDMDIMQLWTELNEALNYTEEVFSSW